MSKKLFDDAKKVLIENDLGGWTRPAPGLYPHQWFWDSCFIAIGYAHFDLERAKQEIDSLLKAQWSNGMMPHVVFSESRDYHAGSNLWKAHRSIYAPKNYQTTGITQPPMLAEAVWRVGHKMHRADRKKYFQKTLPAIIQYHLWLYEERDPDKDGTIGILHPWETGLDNNPAWVSELWKSPVSYGIKVAKQLGVHSLYEQFRKDSKYVPADQRTATIDLLLYYELVRKLRNYRYDSAKLIKHGVFAIDDIGFNSIAVRANSLVVEIAKESGIALPQQLLDHFERAKHAIHTYWCEGIGEYASRNYKTRKFIEEPGISGLLPIYSGEVPSEILPRLVKRILDKNHYGLKYPIPSAPRSSKYFKPTNYWQGPTWINTNWFLIDGLKRAGAKSLSNSLRKRTLELVESKGFWEYYSPLDGNGAGGHPFSWTAALVIDLLND